jgi:hypothetical protein
LFKGFPSNSSERLERLSPCNIAFKDSDVEPNRILSESKKLCLFTANSSSEPRASSEALPKNSQEFPEINQQINQNCGKKIAILRRQIMRHQGTELPVAACRDKMPQI